MSKTLLLADDSITIQKVVAITFANEDYRITSVDNGDDAITKARELKPDIILADVVMPKKNGYEVCEAVKTDPSLKHIPVLLLAGTFEAFDEGRARAASADGHITKPFESQALIDKVRGLVNGGAAPSTSTTAAPKSNPFSSTGRITGTIPLPTNLPPAGLRPPVGNPSVPGPTGIPPAGLKPPGPGLNIPPAGLKPPAGLGVPPPSGIPPAGLRPPNAAQPGQALSPTGIPPAGLRPPGPGLNVPLPNAIPPVGLKPPGGLGAIPPAGLRPPAASGLMPPPNAIPPAGLKPPGGLGVPPPNAIPPAGLRPAMGLPPPPANNALGTPAVQARPNIPLPSVPPAANNAQNLASSPAVPLPAPGAKNQRDPFGLGLTIPTAPQSKAADEPKAEVKPAVSLPDFDFGDLDPKPVSKPGITVSPNLPEEDVVFEEPSSTGNHLDTDGAGGEVKVDLSARPGPAEEAVLSGSLDVDMGADEKVDASQDNSDEADFSNLGLGEPTPPPRAETPRLDFKGDSGPRIEISRPSEPKFEPKTEPRFESKPVKPPVELKSVPLPAAVEAKAQAPVPAGNGEAALEAQLREALSKASRELIERIAWEVVPQLAETIIRQELDRLVKERQGGKS
jgi:CheY-like chemotaxis protein